MPLLRIRKNKGMCYQKLQASPKREAFFLSIGCTLSLALFLTLSPYLSGSFYPSRSANPCPASDLPEEELKCAALIDQMLKAVDAVKGLKYDLSVSERLDGKLRSSESTIKLQRSPRKLYLNIKGTEVLWLEGKNDGDALVNPNRFPYLNLNLNPYGSLMMENQHHTIHEVGYDYFKDIIAYAVIQSGNHFDTRFLYEGIKKMDGRDAYKIMVMNPDFAYKPYRVKKNETLINIARRLRLSEYMIKELNKDLKSYSDLKEGQEIQIPNSYAKMTLMYLDKNLLLPLYMVVYDDKGLFESYSYRNLQLNPDFATDEFTKGFKGYHF